MFLFFAHTAFAEYEDAAIGVTMNTWGSSSKYPITFHDVINMMFIDAIYMGVLSWYFSQIWHSEFGTHKSWYFIFLPSYWLSALGSIVPVLDNTVKPYEPVSTSANQYVEDVSESLAAQVL